MEEKKVGRYWWALLIIIAIAAYNIYDYIKASQNKKNSYLVEESARINKDCPITVDQYTKLDSTNFVQDPIGIHYFYTVSVDKDSVAKDIESIKSGIMRANQNTVDTAPSMQWTRDQNASLTHHYRDRKGVDIFDFTIKPTKQ
jgi:hypothetical protein